MLACREKIGGVQSKCMCSAPHCKALPTGVCYTPVFVGCARCSLYTGHHLMWSLSGWMHMGNRFTYWHRNGTQGALWHISSQVSSLWPRCKKGYTHGCTLFSLGCFISVISATTASLKWDTKVINLQDDAHRHRSISSYNRPGGGYTRESRNIESSTLRVAEQSQPDIHRSW